MNISHTWRGDLEIDLVSPSGTSVRLRNANANDNDSSETILRMILDEIASFRD